MKKHFFKLIILTLLFLIPYIGVSNAILQDIESSTGVFKSATLDMKLLDHNNNSLSGDVFNIKKFTSQDTIKNFVKVSNNGSLPFYYYPNYQFKSGESKVCESINIQVLKNEDEVFDGVLTDFDLSSQATHLSSGSDEWQFIITHTNKDSNLQGKTCEFNIQFFASQSTSSIGFSDIERTSNKITLAYEPTLTTKYNSNTHTFSFSLKEIKNIKKFEYTIKYTTNNIVNGIIGSQELDSESEVTVSKIIGTCSTDSCDLPENPHDFSVEINLTDIDGDIVSLSQEL